MKGHQPSNFPLHTYALAVGCLDWMGLGEKIIFRERGKGHTVSIRSSTPRRRLQSLIWKLVSSSCRVERSEVHRD
jgi:hypothetical protein